MRHEASADIVKIFSGTFSDYLGKRKALTVFGYGLGAISKPIFALAISVDWVFAARFMDRVGKGIRGAPRDALVADLTAPEIRGAAYGLLATMVAGTAPANLRGTAFGFFNLVSGIAMLIASVLAGLLWDKLGAAVTFYAGAVFSLLAFIMLVPGRRRPA